MTWILVATYIVLNDCSHGNFPNPRTWENQCQNPPISSMLGKYQTAKECQEAQEAMVAYANTHHSDTGIKSRYDCVTHERGER